MKDAEVKQRMVKLGSYVAKAKALDPRKFPDEEFELFSVPSHAEGKPEVVLGKIVGASKQMVEDDTVLLCKINPRINRVWVVSSHTNHKKIASSEWMTFPPSPDFLPKYLGYYLQQDELRDHLALNASGVGGSLMRAKPGLVKDFPFPLFPLPQQRRIVEAIELQLGRLDAAVARLQGAKARLKRYKQAVLKAAVEGRLTEEWREKNPNVEHADTLISRLKAMRLEEWERQKKAGERRSLIQNETAEQQEQLDIELPDTWTWATPEEIASPEPYAIGIGPFGSNLKVSDYTSEGVPLIFVRHITSENFDLDLKFTSERKYKELIAHVAKPLDVLVAKMGDPPGDATIYPEDRSPGVMTADCIKLRVWAPHISREYVMHCIRSYVVKQQLGLITIGVAQKKISTGRFKTLLFPMPPTQEQFVIAEMIAERLDRCKATEDLIDAQLQQALRLRQAVLKRAFEGGGLA